MTISSLELDSPYLVSLQTVEKFNGQLVMNHAGQPQSQTQIERVTVRI
jgi:hypothetical protein